MKRIEKMVCATCGNAECAAAQEAIGLDPWTHSCPSWEKDGPYIFFGEKEMPDPGAPRTAQAKKLREVARA